MYFVGLSPAHVYFTMTFQPSTSSRFLLSVFLSNSPCLFVSALLMQHVVEVLSLLSDDVETDDAGPGENLKLRLKGIEEEEILPGFILCNAENLCHSGRTFDAQVSITSVSRSTL